MSDSPAKEATKEPAPAKPRSRFRKWARRLALSTAGAFLILVIWQLAEREWNRIRGESERKLAVSNAEADDPNWTWEKLNAARPRPPEGKNAAALIPAIRPHMPDKWGKQLYAEEWAGRRDVPPNVRYDATLLAEVRRELGASAPGITLAHTLKNYPFGHREHTLGPNVTDTKYEESQWTRSVVALLSWDAVRATEAGDKKRAPGTFSSRWPGPVGPLATSQHSSLTSSAALAGRRPFSRLSGHSLSRPHCLNSQPFKPHSRPRPRCRSY